MALVVTSDVEQEARRIIAAISAFEVLQLNPRDCEKEAVVRQYETKAVLFKRLFRNRLAMQAKARLDDAKMRLLDERLRVKEMNTHDESKRDAMRVKYEISTLESRTQMLEMRAAAIQSTPQK